MAEVLLGNELADGSMHAIYTDVAGDAADVTGVRCVNLTGSAKNFRVKVGWEPDSPTYFTVTNVPANNEVTVSPEPQPLAIAWNPGGPHQEGFQTVHKSPGTAGDEVSFVIETP